MSEMMVSGVRSDDEDLWTSGGTGKASAPFETHPCPCRTEHAPSVPWTHRHHLWPLFAGGPDLESNVVYVCPATHDWAHVIWRVFEKNGGPTKTRHQEWPHYAYRIAREGWAKMKGQIA